MSGPTNGYSNIALMRSCGGAGRDLLTKVGLRNPDRSSGWARAVFEWTRPRRTSPASRRIALVVGERDVAQVSPADSGVKLRRVRQLGRARPQLCGLHRLGDRRPDQIRFHTRVPSVAEGLVRPAAPGRAGNAFRKIP